MPGTPHEGRDESRVSLRTVFTVVSGTGALLLGALSVLAPPLAVMLVLLVIATILLIERLDGH
jgi:hypothetical protein